MVVCMEVRTLSSQGTVSREDARSPYKVSTFLSRGILEASRTPPPEVCEK